MKLLVKVLPRSSCNKIISFDDKILKIKTVKAPVDGAVNNDIINQCSKFFDIPKSLITIILGKKSRLKVLELDVNEVQKQVIQKILTKLK